MTYKDRPESVLITGASSGIGAALARHYAAAGVSLFLSGRHAERLAAVAAACRGKGAIIEEKVIDVTDAESMSAWIREADTRKPLDLVIANAGISGGTGGETAVPFGESPRQVRRIFDINLTGVLNTLEPAVELMLERRSGQIALMSSLASFSGWPGAPAYSASKGAVRLYGESLRGALSGSGVRVSVICPGFIKTPMTDVNDYKMPFMIGDKKAAEIIAAGLAKDRGRIAFPLATYFFSGLLGILPFWLGSVLMKNFPAKPSNTAS